MKGDKQVLQTLCDAHGVVVPGGFGQRGIEGIRMVREQQKTLGGTIRLGAASVQLKPGTLAYGIYGTPVTSDRHRHRYGVNASHVRSLSIQRRKLIWNVQRKVSLSGAPFRCAVLQTLPSLRMS